MLKRALGFQYEEKKVISQKIVIEGANDEEIPAKLIKTEITTKTALPSEAACLILLQHWDLDSQGKTKWSRDLASKEIKEAELEFKKKKNEEESWC